MVMHMNRSVGIIVGVAVATCCGTASFAEDQAPPPQDLRLEARFVGFDSDGHALIDVEIRNIGKTTPVFLNARFAEHQNSAPNPFREIYFDIKGKGVPDPPWLCKINRGFPSRNDYMVLNPGRFVGATFSLGCYALTAGRRYQLVATYEDGGKKPAGFGWVQQVKGAIQSKAIVLDIPASKEPRKNL
jgi:hypothetical protein